MEIAINQQSIYDIVSRSLSIIGKRSVDDQGNLLFKDITLSSNEKNIIEDYILNAVNVLVTELSGFVSNYESRTSTITVTLPSNHNSNIDAFIKKSFEEYIVAYCLYSWFVITAPRITEKYKADMVLQLASLVRMLHVKKAHEGQVEIMSIGTTITPDTPTYTLFSLDTDYFRWTDGEAMTQLTDEEVEALTDEEKEAAVTIPYVPESEEEDNP